MSTLKIAAAAVCLMVLVQAAARAQQTAAQQSPSQAPQAPQSLPDAPQSAQNQNTTTTTDSAKPKHVPSQHHIFWVIPNYREDESGAVFRPLTPHQKFKVAFDDSFDPSAFLVAGVFAGNSMLQRQYPEFEDGAAGFAEYFGGAFADQAVGNMMSEALFPIMLRQDPRYFPKGKGGFWKRAKYAVSREVVTLGDNGRNQFNASEIAGNAVAAGISNLYYPAAERSLSNTANKWGQQLGLDTAFNIMKEYWPDVRQKLFGK